MPKGKPGTKKTVTREPQPLPTLSPAKQRRIELQAAREAANRLAKAEGKLTEHQLKEIRRTAALRESGREPVQRDDLGFILRTGPGGVVTREDPGKAAREWWMERQRKVREAERQASQEESHAANGSGRNTRGRAGKVQPAADAGGTGAAEPARAPRGKSGKPAYAGRRSARQGRGSTGTPVRREGRKPARLRTPED